MPVCHQEGDPLPLRRRSDIRNSRLNIEVISDGMSNGSGARTCIETMNI